MMTYDSLSVLSCLVLVLVLGAWCLVLGTLYFVLFLRLPAVGGLNLSAPATAPGPFLILSLKSLTDSLPAPVAPDKLIRNL